MGRAPLVGISVPAVFRNSWKFKMWLLDDPFLRGIEVTGLRNLISELRASYYYWAFGKQRLMKIKTLVLMWRYFERRRLLKTCCYQKLVVARSLFGTQCNTLLENPICNIYSQFHDNLIFRGNVDERAYREISQLQNQHHFFRFGTSSPGMFFLRTSL